MPRRIMNTNTMSRAHARTFQAANTIGSIDLFQNRKACRTDPIAAAAMNTTFRRDGNAYAAYAIERGKKSPKRAYPATEGTSEDNGKKQDGNQDEHFPGEELTQHAAEIGIQQGEKNAALKCSRRADELAECRLAPAELIDHKKGEQDDRNDQKQVFAIPQKGRRNGFGPGKAMEKILEETEGAAPATSGPSDERTDNGEKADHVKGGSGKNCTKPFPPCMNGCWIESAAAGNNRLDRADGARTECSRATITVQHGDAHVFSVALVDAAGKESFHVGIHQEGRNELYPKTLNHACFITSTDTDALQANGCGFEQNFSGISAPDTKSGDSEADDEKDDAGNRPRGPRKRFHGHR